MVYFWKRPAGMWGVYSVVQGFQKMQEQSYMLLVSKNVFGRIDLIDSLNNGSLSVIWKWYIMSSLQTLDLFPYLCVISPPYFIFFTLSTSVTLSPYLRLCRVPEGQQRVAGCYLNLMCQIKTLYLAYCSSHPSAVCILTDHRSVAPLSHHNDFD